MSNLMVNTCHSHGCITYLRIIKLIMPKRKSACLAAPLNGFMVPVVSWRPSLREFREFQETSRVTYIAPEVVKIQGQDWHCIKAYDVRDDQLGNFLLPMKYYPLWRRLVYGA